MSFGQYGADDGNSEVNDGINDGVDDDNNKVNNDDNNKVNNDDSDVNYDGINYSADDGR